MGNKYDKIADLYREDDADGAGGVWGSITGTLSSQADLQAALDAKLSVASFNLSTFDTDDLVEGSNLYFTNERAQDAVGNAVGNGLDYDDTTGAIAVDETELLHNSLGSKQGGTAGEFYHLTSAQNTLVGALDADLATFSLPASTTISAFGASLIDDADAATARTTLGLVAGGAGDIWVEKAGDTMTGNLTISNTAPSLVLTDTTASAKSLTCAVDANVAEIRESAAAAGTLLALDLTNNRIGVGTSAPGFKFEVQAAITSASTDPVGMFTNTSSGNAVLGMNNSGTGNANFGFYIDGGINGSVGFSRNGDFLGLLNVLYSGNDFIVKINSDGSFTYNNGSTSAELVRMNVSGNVGIGTSTWGTSAATVLGIKNGTEPSTSPADMVQIYSVDLSAGNATLGLRTETAVVTEAVTSDRTLSVKINGTAYKILLKS